MNFLPNSNWIPRVCLVVAMFVILAGCKGQNEPVKNEMPEEGRTIEGVKEGPWFKYRGDSLENVSYYYGGELKFGLSVSDFSFLNHCPDSSSFCWDYPANWEFDELTNGLLSWVDNSSIHQSGVASPVVNCASIIVPSETAENIGTYLVSAGVEAVEMEADSISILENRQVAVLSPNVYGHKFICIIYKDGVCYGLCRIIASSDGEALVITGTASCDNDEFVKKLSVYVEMGSTVKLMGQTVFDYDLIWKN